jgi:predicted nucleotidyltransferase
MKWPPENLDDLLSRASRVLRSAGAREVYVFGTAAEGRLREDSDIDLAVSGLPPASLLSTLVRIDEIFGRYVDLVNLDRDTPFTNYLRSKEGLLRRVA